MNAVLAGRNMFLSPIQGPLHAAEMICECTYCRLFVASMKMIHKMTSKEGIALARCVGFVVVITETVF